MVDTLSSAVLRRLVKETSSLRQDPPEGIRIIPNEEDITDVKAWVAGPPGTPYAGGYFKIRFAFPAEYPNAPPKCYFVTKIFHPNVGPSGDVCVSTLKKDWSSRCTLSHILVVIKCLLIYPNPESALNEEAGRLLLEEYEEYASRAKLMATVHGGVNKAKPIEYQQECKAEMEARLAAKTTACVDNVTPTVPASAPLQPTTSVQNTGCVTKSPVASLSKKRSVTSALGEFGNSVIGNMGGVENVKESKPTSVLGPAVKKVAASATKKRGLKRL